MLYSQQKSDLSDELALSHIAHVLNQWELLHSVEATDLAIRAFSELAGAGHIYLNVVEGFAAKTKTRLGDRGTPPRFYFEEVFQQMEATTHDAVPEYVEHLSIVQKQKAILTVGIIERFQDFFAAQPTGSKWHGAQLETCHKEHLKHALHITGSIVRQVINHLSDVRHAEINFSKNPWTSAGLPLRQATP